ncbi:hypothetical protein H4CHR_05989 [Variovorax sp. PBS-H4]|uniref:hypothetical protein n=1 Tax=Variovorax sp. PBS-H4 TaxID=434008 RepID=UPI001319187D|nr:hypothetical protein [Variovorax sp. PBS-H4]VTU41254.1 hypothetical protein H4CHR_05989 [Variovorax sp. PBS-H4]
MTNSSGTHSGDGTRPTTSGGTDNIGAGEKFSGKRSQAGSEDNGPAPAERMTAKRKDAEASEHEDSAAFGLREDMEPETNKEPPPTSGKKSGDGGDAPP